VFAQSLCTNVTYKEAFTSLISSELSVL